MEAGVWTFFRQYQSADSKVYWLCVINVALFKGGFDMLLLKVKVSNAFWVRCWADMWWFSIQEGVFA